MIFSTAQMDNVLAVKKKSILRDRDIPRDTVRSRGMCTTFHYFNNIYIIVDIGHGHGVRWLVTTRVTGYWPVAMQQY